MSTWRPLVLPAARPARPGKGRIRAFTLIELLVVVALLSLLLAMLSPSLSRARELTRAAACLSNLHQLGTAGHTYRTVYKCLPPESPSIMGSPVPVDAWPGRFLKYTASPAVFKCPSAPSWMEWDGLPFKRSYGSQPFSYGLNVWGWADSARKGWWKDAAGDGRRAEEIAMPANFYWLADSNGGMEIDPLGRWDLVMEVHRWDWCWPWEAPGSRHLDRTGMLYADAHSESMLFDDIFLNETLPAGHPDRGHWQRKTNYDNEVYP